MPPFRVVSDFDPAGAQPEAIDRLAEGILAGEDYLTLLGITGSGKTFTIAKVVERLQKPTLVISPNKSLAAQLANEFREFFPHNAVEYFVSYYDYYQPEAYVPQTDTYIEKDSSINDEIDRLRHSATSALLTRDDVLIVASVSCIYGLGSPEEYMEQILHVQKGQSVGHDFVLQRLVDMHYQRNQANLTRGAFRVQGDTIEVHPAYEETALRIELWGDDVERLLRLNLVTGEVLGEIDDVTVYAATHYVASEDRMKRAITTIEAELGGRLADLESQNKLLEAQRLRMRTNHDLEMMRELGFCSGIENYSRHIDGRAAGTAPHTLLDYFPSEWLCVIDESHVT
ncbi:MAG TPA: DEAD/DEAH box helicase family protein, partial [Actinomycetota bacterium]|nr:DEAD/DEAH box helicase family protein [Actinomycetota bacterium]